MPGGRAVCCLARTDARGGTAARLSQEVFCPIATHRETRKYTVPVAQLKKLVAEACAGLGIAIEETDEAAGLQRGSQPTLQHGEPGPPREWEIRLRALGEGQTGASLQVRLQDLLALDGGTRLLEAVGEFFQRLEGLMKDKGLSTEPPAEAPVAIPKAPLSPLVWLGGALAVLAVLVILSYAGVFSPKPDAEKLAALTPGPKPPPKEQPMPDLSEVKGSVVKMQTTKGTIVIETFDKEAPITAGNFLDLIKSGFYNGVTFHRVVPDFVIQGGDPTGTGGGGPGWTIPDELKPDLKHDRGMLSMAKTAAPNTGGSQFFVVKGPAQNVSHLNMKHAVFGKVLQGMDVVDAIVVGDKMTSVTVEKESPDMAAAIEAAKKARVKGNK